MIEFDGIEVKVTRKAIKHLYFRINRSNGELEISAPVHYDNQKIRQHLETKRDWILKHRQRLLQLPKSKEKKYHDGDSIDYLGQSYRLRCLEKSDLKLAIISHEHLILYCSNKANSHEKQALLERWYQKQMQEIIPDLLRDWAKKIAVNPKEWRIRKMKTRWGSCNIKDKRIWLNLKLMEKPLRCIELVVVHELVHLLEPSHNKRFYNLMSSYLPDWKESQDLLEGKITL